MPYLAVQCFLKVEIPTVTQPLLLQNYQLDPLIYEGETYSFAAFQFQTQPQQSLELEASSGTILLRNTAALQSLLEQYDNLERSVVTVVVERTDTARQPYQILTQVYSTSIEDGNVVFSLRLPTSALQGRLTNQRFSKKDFQELVYRSP